MCFEEETITRYFRKIPLIFCCFSAFMYLSYQLLDCCLPSRLRLLLHSTFNGLLWSQKLSPISWCLYVRQIICLLHSKGNCSVLSLKMYDIVRESIFFTLLLGNLYNYDLRTKAHFWVDHATRQTISSQVSIWNLEWFLKSVIIKVQNQTMRPFPKTEALTPSKANCFCSWLMWGQRVRKRGNILKYMFYILFPILSYILWVSPQWIHFQLLTILFPSHPMKSSS